MADSGYREKSRIADYGLLLAVVMALAFSIAFTITAFAQNPTPTDDEVNRIAKQLYCPVCESTPLDVCPTEACRQWRDLIRQMLSEGKSEAEIKQYFVAQYGVRVLNEPPNPYLTYLVPGVAILLGALILARAFQMWRRPIATEPVSPGPEAKPIQDDYVAKLEEELKKRN